MLNVSNLKVIVENHAHESVNLNSVGNVSNSSFQYHSDRIIMKQTFVEFKVDVNDVITPFSCSAMVIEFIKYIVYQKQLIPYPYERLKMYVNQRKKQLSAENESTISSSATNNSKQSLISHKYFKKTEAAHDSLENMFKVIADQFTSSSHNQVEEVVLLLGSSFTNPQDVFRLCIPVLKYNHLSKYHSTQKNCRNLFRTMINSDEFNDIVCGHGCTGNLHILLKMKTMNVTNNNLFIPRTGFKLPSKGNHAVIVFKDDNVNSDCSCGEFQIFQDAEMSNTATKRTDYLEDELTSCSNTIYKSENERWYQIKDTLKYFADVTVNNISLTDVWMNPKVVME